IVNYDLNPAVKQSYLKSNINNILILGKTGAGKTYLLKEYCNNSSIEDPLFLDNTFLKYMDDFDSLFAEYKLIIIDGLEQLFFSLSQDKKPKFINCLKGSLKNPNKTVIITNQQPIPLTKLNKIAQNADYPLAEFDLILAGSLSHFAATNSYFSELDSFTESRNFPLYYCQPSESYFLVYPKGINTWFELTEISQAKYIFRQLKK
ncbi:MAG: hypothetical protein AB4372_03360, partial [Xenococcus sp. (in: cyanobacteria)]